MEIRHLKLIKAVAEKGSLTKAVDDLFLSQSALSHQLKEIETQLGTSLFHRINKRLVITSAGKIVYESAKKILEEIENTEVAIKKNISGGEGKLRIATECFTCYHWLPGLMKDFKREFPKVELEIFPKSTTQPIKHVLAGKLDIAIVSGEKTDLNVSATELFTDELVAVVPNHHAWAKKKYVNPKDFQNQTIIIHSFPLSSVTLFRELLIPHDIQPKKVLDMQVTEAIIEMIKADMGIMVFAKWIIEPHLKGSNLSLVPVTKRGLFRKWYAVTLKESETPAYVENFIKHLKYNTTEKLSIT